MCTKEIDSDHVRYTHLVITNREDKDALGLFNPNAYPKSPEYIQETLFSCIERLSLIVYHAKSVSEKSVEVYNRVYTG